MSVATQIAALETAIEAGVRTVTEGGRTITYHSLSEMETALQGLHTRQATSGGGLGVRMFPLAHGDGK